MTSIYISTNGLSAFQYRHVLLGVSPSCAYYPELTAATITRSSKSPDIEKRYSRLSLCSPDVSRWDDGDVSVPTVSNITGVGFGRRIGRPLGSSSDTPLASSGPARGYRYPTGLWTARYRRRGPTFGCFKSGGGFSLVALVFHYANV